MRTAVFLCRDLKNRRIGLDLEEIRTSLEATVSEVSVEVAPDLCDHPERIIPTIAREGAERAVLGLCSDDYSEIDLQASARRAGLDPFGVEIIDLGALCGSVHLGPHSTQKAQTLLLASIAKACAFRGSSPANSKAYLLTQDQKVSRRLLFTLPPIGYRSVPCILGQKCVAERGCELCVQACPRGAMERTAGRISLDKARCERCGICVTACPRQAVYFPGWSLPQLEAQLSTLLRSTDPIRDRPALLFVCEKTQGRLAELARHKVSYSHRWLPVILPCLGMLTPTWLLQVLAGGAEKVALLSCRPDCALAQQQAIDGRTAFCREFLHNLEQDPHRVTVVSYLETERLIQVLRAALPEGVKDRNESEKPLHLGSLDSTVEAMRLLAGNSDDWPEDPVDHDFSPFGVAELRDESCTGCLKCAEVCPTGALASQQEGDAVILSFLGSACIGCGMCARACPEASSDVLRVRKATELNFLVRGRVVLHSDEIAVCQSCGASFASQGLLRRIGALLEGPDETLNATLTRYCPSCRLSATLGPSAFSTG